MDDYAKYGGVVMGVMMIALTSGLWVAYQKINLLSHSVETLQASVGTLADNVSSSTAARVEELARRDQVAQRSQTTSLQEAVARVTPAVVSIVESRQVPKLQVSYENPFGNDPFFRGFGMQVPVYRQIGTTTRKVGAGTGFIVRSSGYIVTNKHVVPDVNATYSILLSDGRQKQGTVLWRSTSEDLAVVKIAGEGYPVIPLGDSSSLSLAESVFAVGNALGEYNNSVSVGVISGLNRTITAGDYNGSSETLTGIIQTDASINPGNSGGPLADLQGNVIGVNVATVQGAQNIGFAVPINEVSRALANLGI